MSGPGRGLVRAACAVAALALVAMLVFGVSTAGADPPTFTPDPPPDITMEATGPTTPVSYSPSAVDDGGANTATVVCNPPSGTAFAVVTTPVTCDATDPVDLSVTTRSFNVIITDQTPPTITTPGSFGVEATSSAGATVNYNVTASDIVDGSITPICTPASGSAFQLGTTQVNCTATDAHSNQGTASFNVTVVDTTPPTLSNVPTNISMAATGTSTPVSWSSPTATDLVDGSPTVNCAPASGSGFAVGTTTVSCTASDHSNNTSAAQTFTVTITDSVAPSLVGMPGNINNVAATGPGGAAVSYTPPTATDNVDPSPSVSCSPSSGATFPIGTTTVTCTATDSSNNQSSATFTVTVVDSTAPVLALPGTQTAEATGPGGAAVSFSATASDNVDPNPSVNCSPASGSTFPLGSTTVNCTAHDAANNQSTGTFTVNVVDTTAPAFSNVPSPPTFEANSAAGSAVGYTAPTAFDLVSGAVLVVCSPPSGSGFPIGATVVDCQASDTHGNVGHAQFSIRVADRTPPVISAPPFLTVYATTPTGIPSNDPTVIAAAKLITARDNIDPNPVITNDMPDFLPVGHTLAHFYASDRYGNRAGTNMDVDVLPKPTGPAPPLPVPDAKPPQNVSSLSAKPGNGSVTLSWKLPSDADLDHITVSRSDPADPGLGTPEYSGRGTKFTDRGLTNDKQYRYVIVSYDAVGNRSVGIAILATPHVAKLISPVDGAVVKKPPVLTWRPAAEADYYNIQLFRDSGKALTSSFTSTAKKILSVWPRGTRFALKKKWKFEGRTYRLTKGTYRWFVWPGFGARAQNNYGTLLGENTFTVK